MIYALIAIAFVVGYIIAGAIENARNLKGMNDMIFRHTEEIGRLVAKIKDQRADLIVAQDKLRLREKQIWVLEAKIAEARKQIMAESITEVEKPEQPQCKKCGRFIRVGQTYCDKCFVNKELRKPKTYRLDEIVPQTVSSTSLNPDIPKPSDKPLLADAKVGDIVTVENGAIGVVVERNDMPHRISVFCVKFANDWQLWYSRKTGRCNFSGTGGYSHIIAIERKS